MTRKRLTRVESRDQTTQHLLDAAQRLIAKNGVTAVSVERIASDAGYTRGAFYSNFDSKEALFIALLRRDHQKTHLEIRALQDDSIPLEDIQRRLLELYVQTQRSPETFINWPEARMLAARNSQFRAELDVLLAEKRSVVAAFIQYFFRRAGIPPPGPPATLAVGVLTLYEGARLAMLSGCADMTGDTATAILTMFIDSIKGVRRLRASAGNLIADERHDD